MTLDEARKLSDLFTSKTSELTRQLAFAAIAVIWVFKTTGTGTLLPPKFVWPLWLFVVALMFDFLHYLIAGVLWDRFTQAQEKKYGADKDTKIEDAPNWINLPHAVCYVLKVGVLLLGYALLLSALWGQIA